MKLTYQRDVVWELKAPTNVLKLYASNLDHEYAVSSIQL